MWGTPNTAAETISQAALERAEQDEVTLIGDGERAGSPDLPAGAGTDAAMPVVLATRLVYAMEDDDSGVPIAVAREDVAGSPDVLAAVEEQWRARTGRDDVRVDVRAEPPADQPPVDESA